MKLFSGISICEGGSYETIRAMHSNMKMFDLATKNIINFGMVGYQRQVPIKTSFSEYIGSHGIETITDDQPGRMSLTGNPLDVLLETKGYFQIQSDNTIKLTRDGRFKIDKEGYLKNLSNENILGSDGEAIFFEKIPDKLEDVRIEEDGKIYLYNKNYKSKEYVGKLSVAMPDGSPAQDVKVKQAYIEESNVDLSSEFFDIVPLRRYFEANKQAFVMQSQNYDKLLQMLGKAQ